MNGNRDTSPDSDGTVNMYNFSLCARKDRWSLEVTCSMQELVVEVLNVPSQIWC